MKRSPRRTPGFSLLELMLVLAIIGVLMAVAAYNVLGQGEKAKRRATGMTMGTIKNALVQYNLDYSTYPPNLQTLVTMKLIEDKLKDGWGQPLHYNPATGNPARPFDLLSLGADKSAGTADDIDVWTMDSQKP